MPITSAVLKYLLASCLFTGAALAGEISVEEEAVGMEPRERPTVAQSCGGYD
jgi:hypothetical protein